MKSKNLPIVTIFGRTNVGKSSLFNCLTEKKQALVANHEGTTRDCNMAEMNWRRTDFTLVDTGGIIDVAFLTARKKKKTDDIEASVQNQAVDFLKRSDIILFLVDNKTGLLPQDREMIKVMKKVLPDMSKVLLVANKVDSFNQRAHSAEFHKLAMGEPILISAVTGSGTGDLLDIITEKIKADRKAEPAEEEENDESEDQPTIIKKPINVCFIGKPNVGKSSLLNQLLGYERVIVSPVAHTTREPQNTIINYKDTEINLIDTAGISKKAQISQKKPAKGDEMLYRYGIAKSLGTLNKADIILFVIDINQELTHQDAQIVDELVKRQKSIIIIANKWDLAEERDTKKYNEYIFDNLPFIRWAPVQYISALTGEKINKVLDLILQIEEERKTSIPANELNTFLMKVIKVHKPAKAKGLKHPYIYKFEQINTNPPRFKMRIGTKDTLHFSYVRFMENRMREKWGFTGTPIKIDVTKNRQVHGAHQDKRENHTKKRKFRNKKF